MIPRTQFPRMLAMLCVSTLILLSNLLRAEVSLISPKEGGTPRDKARIEQMGATEFRVSSSVEEGRSPLRHAVSRVDLLCVNTGTQPVKVTIHADLSGSNTRTSYDDAPHAGMPLRDFAFIQVPRGRWTQIKGTTHRWVSTLSFQAPPGETKFGLSPWYTYTDLEQFIASLPEHPHLKREVLGKSDRGRNHWELTITDPSVARGEKRVIFWHAREHAYETFSSFAMESLIPFLLSDASADYRRRNVFVLHPMTNVDGVASGFEYRGGYDFPEPRGTATGRMTFDTMDRLKPDFSVAWHNWVAPRDRDDLSFTDSEGGKPSARAWYLFTQRFPSPRAQDHRWRNETNALSFNWGPRRPYNLGNVHQYAMARHGTALWGWEMPWWNRTVEDAHAMGIAFARAFIATLDDLKADRKLPLGEAAPFDTAKWESHEFSLKGRANVTDPFCNAALVGEFKSPSGRTIVLDGFHDGGESWKLRFAPDEEGEWTYLLRGEGVSIFQRGSFRCTPPINRGPIRIHQENPYAFTHADGSPFFPMGDTCYGLYDDGPVTPELRTAYLKLRRSQKFNFVRMQIRQSRDHADKDPAFWPWGGTPKDPDLTRINPAFFKGLDEVVLSLRKAGMNAELILLNYYRFPMNDPKVWTVAHERRWLRYVVARYGAFDNIFLWTISNEYETHPDGKYRLDYPADVDWARETAAYLKKIDVHGHLLTVHPVISSSTQGSGPQSPYEAPWRIGEFFGEEPAIDVLSQQTSLADSGLTWDEIGNFWNGDDRAVAASVAADRRYQKPVLNTENGYEYLKGYPNERRQVHHTDKVRRTSWQIVFSGGNFAAGFVGTLAHSDNFNVIDAPNRYSFRVADQGAGEQLAILYAFMTGQPFWKLKPVTGFAGNALGLSDGAGLSLFYLPHGGSFTLKAPIVARNAQMRWFDPRTGEMTPPLSMDAASQTVEAPSDDDWILEVASPVDP